MNYRDWFYMVHNITVDMERNSPESVTAIMQIIAHESNGGKHWEQLGGGPALGVIQMEPKTHDSTWNNSDSIHQLSERLMIVRNVNQLKTSAIYNIFMARCYLLMDPDPLPAEPLAMSYYLKKYWNSAEGKAGSDDYYNKWMKWRNGKL